MTNKKRNIAILLGDPSGIGPELVSKLLSQNELDQANIIVIGEKNILGIMPHPERLIDPLLSGIDGSIMFESLLKSK